MRISEIMTTELVTADPGESLAAVGERMIGERVGSTLIVDDAPVGIVTERDLIQAACRTERGLDDVRVETAMSAPLVTVDPGASVEAALRRMSEEGVKKLPVRDGLDLLGIVTLTDVALHLPEHLAEVRRIEAERGDWTD